VGARSRSARKNLHSADESEDAAARTPLSPFLTRKDLHADDELHVSELHVSELHISNATAARDDLLG
jgi:hypothetical protein